MAELTPDIRTVSLKHYFPLTVAPSLEFKELAITEDIEFNRLWPELWRLFIRAYVNYFDEAGASRWEEMLSLTPAANATLDDRRHDILAKIMFCLPYTERKLQSLLDDIFGAGLIKVEVDYNKYNLTLTIDDNNLPMSTIYRYVRVIIPANLGVQWIFPLKLKWNIKHLFRVGIAWIGKQNYWSVGYSNTQTLYWEGEHKLNGENHTHYFDSTYRHDAIEGNENYIDDQRHFLYAGYYQKTSQKVLTTNKGLGKITGYACILDKPKYKMTLTDISSPVLTMSTGQQYHAIKVIDCKQSANGAIQYNNLNGSWKINGLRTLTASVYKKGMCSHTATVTIVKGDIKTEVDL